MKSIVILLAMVGIIFLAVGYVKSNLQCPPNKIEYRYVEKTFDQEQNVQTPIMGIQGMKSMFEDTPVWIQNESYATKNVHEKYL